MALIAAPNEEIKGDKLNKIVDVYLVKLGADGVYLRNIELLLSFRLSTSCSQFVQSYFRIESTILLGLFTLTQFFCF